MYLSRKVCCQMVLSTGLDCKESPLFIRNFAVLYRNSAVGTAWVCLHMVEVTILSTKHTFKMKDSFHSENAVGNLNDILF